MTEPAVIQAVYADFRLIKTRSCLQLVFEVPVERATEALAIFGVPNHLTAIHVAIARLQGDVKPATSGAIGAEDDHYSNRLGVTSSRDESRETRPEPKEATRKVDTAKSERAKASYRMSDDGERAVTRAAILCNDEEFISWMLSRHGYIGAPRSGVAHLLRAELGITTRREIATNERTYAAFLALEAEYRAAVGQMAELR